MPPIKSLALSLAFAAPLAAPAVAAAQQAPASDPAPEGPTKEQRELLALAAQLSQSVFAGDWVTIGAGAGLVPSYEGSDNYIFFPAPVLAGSVSGYNFSARGPGLFVDLVKDRPFQKTEIIAGPIVRARIDRNGRIQDPVVQQLGELDTALELGASAGFQVNRILGKLDSLTFQVDATTDVAGAHSGVVVSPSIAYSTPLGTAGLINLSVSADWVDDDYADYYFSVTPAGAAATGLPAFQASGAVKSVSATGFATFDLSGNALDGGWGVFGIASYTRLRADMAASPIVAIRGDANQIFLGAGLTYTF